MSVFTSVAVFIAYLMLRYTPVYFFTFVLKHLEHSQWCAPAECWMRVEQCGSYFTIHLTIARSNHTTYDVVRRVSDRHFNARQLWYLEYLVEKGVILVQREITAVCTPFGMWVPGKWWVPQADEIEALTMQSRLIA